MNPLLTLVIPTYERQSFVRRQLLYFSDKPVHIIIADGSLTPWEDGVTGSSGKMTWEYFNIAGYGTYSARLFEASTRVKTQYVCMTDDEDGLLWTGLKTAVNFLNQNPDHVCAGGRVAETLTNKDIFITPWGHRSGPLDLTDDNPITRIRKLYSEDRTANLFYQVTRTPHFHYYAKSTRYWNLSNEYNGSVEILWTGFLALTGKSLLGSYPYWFRNGSFAALIQVATQEFMSQTEMKKVVAILMAGANSMTIDSNKKLGSSSVEIDLINSIIDRRWGSGLKLLNEEKLRKESLHFKNFSSKMKNRTKSAVLKVLATFLPSLYLLLLKRHMYGKPNENWECLSFLDYGIKYGSESSEILSDLLLIKTIWKTFKTGVPKDLFLQHHESSTRIH